MTAQEKKLHVFAAYCWINGAYVVGLLFVSWWFLVLLPVIAAMFIWIMRTSDNNR